MKINFDLDYWKKSNLIIGIDEAGRGAWAGPIVIAGVVLPRFYENDLINDSKKLTPILREKAYDQIIKDAIYVFTEFMDVDLVEKLNPKKATICAMSLICDKINDKDVDLVITDFEKVDTNLNQINLKKGDESSISVAAASIIAKVTRDWYMTNLENEFPNYTFSKHKGYGTALHTSEINKFGICVQHRKSYKPIQKYLDIKKEDNE